MNDQDVLLERRPERVRRHPIIFFLFFWLLPISTPAWVIAYIESKVEKLKITKERMIYRRGIIIKNNVV